MSARALKFECSEKKTIALHAIQFYKVGAPCTQASGVLVAWVSWILVPQCPRWSLLPVNSKQQAMFIFGLLLYGLTGVQVWFRLKGTHETPRTRFPSDAKIMLPIRVHQDNDPATLFSALQQSKRQNMQRQRELSRLVSCNNRSVG